MKEGCIMKHKLMLLSICSSMIVGQQLIADELAPVQVEASAFSNQSTDDFAQSVTVISGEELDMTNFLEKFSNAEENTVALDEELWKREISLASGKDILEAIKHINESSDEFVQYVNLDSIIVSGHSLGGSISQILTSQYVTHFAAEPLYEQYLAILNSVKATITIDGGDSKPNGWTGDINAPVIIPTQPALYITQSEWEYTENTISKLLETQFGWKESDRVHIAGIARNPGNLIKIRNTVHESFTRLCDSRSIFQQSISTVQSVLGTLRSILRPFGASDTFLELSGEILTCGQNLPTERVDEIVSTYIKAFIDRHIYGQDPAILRPAGTQSAGFTEVEMRYYEGIELDSQN